MKTIFQDSAVRKLAQACTKLAHRLGNRRRPSSFIQSAMFATYREGRLREKSGVVCIGAIEMELLERRGELRWQLQSRSGKSAPCACLQASEEIFREDKG